MNVLNSSGALLAIETNNADMLRMILSRAEIPFNSRISDAYLEDWTLLEFAVMLDHRQCAEVLLQSGATVDVESCPLKRRLEQIREHTELIIEQIHSLKIRSIQNNDKQLQYLEKRLSQMKTMKAVLENTIFPEPLADVEAVVSASDQLTVSWKDVHQHNLDLVVNYKVEWSLCDDFNSVEGSLLVNTVMRSYAVISKLKHGLRYSVRVSPASIRGFGHPIAAVPQSLLISMFPKTIEISGKKKKGSIKSLFSGGFRFLKVVQRGIYLVSIIYSEMKVYTIEERLPVILIDQTQFCVGKDEMYWAIKLSLAWDEIQTLQETNRSCSSNSRFRNKFIDAAVEMHTALGLTDIGRVHYQPIIDEVNSVSFIVTVRFANRLQVAQGLTTRWLPLSKIVRKRGTCQAMDVLWAEIFRIINFFESSYKPLRRGLENPHITKEEWDLLRSVEINASNPPTPVQLVFYTALVSAASRLLHDLEIDTDLIPDQRVYRLQVFQLQFDVSFIILLPKIEDVCTAPNHSLLKSFGIQKGCSTLPLHVFETIHLCAYNADFINIYCRLSLFIEHFSTYIQYEQRNSLLEKDICVYADVLSKLNEFQQRLGNVWKSTRWVANIAFMARDKRARGLVPMKSLIAINNGISRRGYQIQGTRVDLADSRVLLHLDSEVQLRITTPLTDSPAELSHSDFFQPKKNPTTRVIKVYPAYHCGLTCGTSVRLQIASATTASEIVALVLSQLSKTAEASGKPIKTRDPEDFCLAVVVGSRERRLRDNFQPMKLQNPWDEGRLFVRRRDTVLAALERGNEAAV